uniref:HDIG domain-containing protein n=1 Tax=candidate division CPR3 bacterium TaxID=2268181 RepID=A0A7V3J9M0_UNCC3
MIDKSLKSSIVVIGLIFLSNFLLNILAVLLAGVLSLKVSVYLFLFTFISSLLAVTVLGGFFTGLSASLLRLSRLLKLNNLTHPLLLRLSAEAPGTYHHSILVADLSSKAAKVIGADSLLCRVASYFHDIGKLKNPALFVENSKNEQNNQDLDLLENAKFIKNHVEDGIRLAKDAHLPQTIINLIAQHHGTSLCSYFYDLAKSKGTEGIRKADFRYKGPKPQTKEAAIVMLADALEAKARVKDNSSSIKDLVEETFADKINDGQLNESTLSERELFKLKQSFIKTLESMAHQRIEYTVNHKY